MKYWDGKESSYLVEIEVKPKAGKVDENVIVELNKNNRTYLEMTLREINFIEIKNVPIFVINVSWLNSSNNGAMFDIHDENVDMTIIYSEDEVNKFQRSGHSSCRLVHCEVGLQFLLEKSNQDSQNQPIENIDVSKYKSIYYLKVITDSKNFLISHLTIEKNSYPLIICPYESWVNKLSQTKFIPYTNNGLFLEKLYNRHVLVPIYTNKINENKFICGYIKYPDNDKLYVGFELEYINEANIMEISKINLLNETLTCSENTQQSDYYYFEYSKNSMNDIKMIYIDPLNKKKKSLLYHDSVVYMYNRNDPTLATLNTAGLNKESEINDRTEPPQIKPLCAKKISHLNGVIKLFDQNDIEISMEMLDQKSDKRIYFIDDYMNNEDKKYKCKIILKENISMVGIDTFYKNTFNIELISNDTNGNEVVVKSINFTNDSLGFGDYQCKLKSINSTKLHEDSKYIKELKFQILPRQLNKKNVTWQNLNQVKIVCPKKLFNIVTLDSMNATVTETYIYSTTLSNNLFVEKDDYIMFNFQNINSTEKNILYYCSYKLYTDILLSQEIEGNILEDIKLVDKNNVDNSSSSNFLHIILIFIWSILICMI